ncbi:MAG: prolipoprotein diacylglyceryl transferase [Bacilli bacterium]
MSPVIFSIKDFEIRWYSVLILSGVFLAYLLIMNESKRQKVKTDFMFNLMFWGLIFGILGARIYYVIFNLDYYMAYPSEIYKIWNGGLAIHGGILFGLITAIIYCKKYKANTKKVLDILAPGVLLAQAIGRWGNFFNAEAYGSIVSYKTLVNMKIIPQFVIDNMLINGDYHLPMFYFESIACLIGVIVMLIVRRFRYIKKGQIMSIYLIWYGIIRFIIEIFRTDSLMLFDFKVAQIVSVIMVFVGIYIIISQHQKPKLEDLYNRYDEEIKF